MKKLWKSLVDGKNLHGLRTPFMVIDYLQQDDRQSHS